MMKSLPGLRVRIPTHLSARSGDLSKDSGVPEHVKVLDPG
jgi:hypothetical protein